MKKGTIYKEIWKIQKKKNYTPKNKNKQSRVIRSIMSTCILMTINKIKILKIKLSSSFCSFNSFPYTHARIYMLTHIHM